MASSYTVAGFEVLSGLLDKFFSRDCFDNHFTRDDISNFFGKVCNKFLHSFGSNFKGKKNFENYNKNKANLLIKCRNTKFFDKSEFFIDSGGFQISVGILNKKESERLEELYYSFLQEFAEIYERAFILDVVPGPNCKVFKNFDEVYNINNRTYNTAKNMPKKVRDKIMYIHHFRTPKLWDIFTKLLNQNDMFESFKYHATGGIVANGSSDSIIPCFIYVFPLVPLLKKCIECKRKTLNFHILGGATFRDVFFYEIVKLHVKKVHNIDLKITFDSSAIFKGLMVGRIIHVPGIKKGEIKKLSLKSSELELHQVNNKKTIDVVQENLSEMANFGNLKDIDLKGMYDPDTGTFFREVTLYLMLYVLFSYYKFQTDFKNIAHEIYPLFYENHDKFTNMISEVLISINNSKFTKKIRAKTGSITNTLKILENLDEDYCKFMVNKFLSKDEFLNLKNNGLDCLTI